LPREDEKKGQIGALLIKKCSVHGTQQSKNQRYRQRGAKHRSQKKKGGRGREEGGKGELGILFTCNQVFYEIERKRGRDKRD